MGGLLILVALAVAAHAVLVAPTNLQTTIVDAPISGLAREFDGYTLVVLTDIHHRRGSETQHLRRLVETSNAADPDLIVLLGDYGASFHHNRPLSAALYEWSLPALGFALRKLRSRDGIVAVLGNHDHYHDAGRVTKWLEAIGAHVLVNSHVVMRRGEQQLAIGGVGDALEGHVDAMGGAGTRPRGTPLVVLSHNPDGVLSLSREAGIGLVLSGHTHGGQIVIPGYGAPVTFTRICGRRTASGWVPNPTAPLYVGRGAGAQWPIRFCCPPEVLIVRLRVDSAQQPA
jgi:hypothetical protein